MFNKLSKEKTKILQILTALVIIASIATISFSLGYNKGTQNPQVEIIKGVTNLDEGKDSNVDFSLFWKAWKILKDKYVDADKLTNQDLVNGAISGMVGATKDSYTVYMPPQEAKGFNEEISGEFGGIGAEIGVRNDQLTIISPIKNSPAEKSGLKAGDKIIKIDNTVTSGMSAEDAVAKIRGKKGTKVTLAIFRDGWNDTKDFAITRDTIEVPTLDWKMINDQGKDDPNGKILYIQLYNFYEKAPMLFYQAIFQASFKNPQGIILDLRNNPGGYLEAASNIAGWFLDKNSIVTYEKLKSGDQQPIKADGPSFLKNMPVVVLINQGSASASEILAGALHDDRGIKLVGKKSFGKGSVQDLTVLNDGSQLKITIAHWLTPKGVLIDKNGIAPDIEMDLTEDDTKAGKDPQLDKATEVLQSEISK